MNESNRTISDGELLTVPTKHKIKKDVEHNALMTRSMEQMTVTPAPKPALRKSRSAPHGQLRNNSFYMEPAPVAVYLNSTSPPQMQPIPTMQPIQRIPSMQPYVYQPPPYVPYSAPSFYYSPPPPPAPTYIIRRNPPPAVPYDCYGPNFDACFGPDVRPIHNTSTVAQQREQLEAIQLSRSTYRDRLPNARNNDNNMSVAEAKALEEAIQLSLTESSRRACRNEQSTDFSHTTGEGNSGYTTATSSSKSHHWAEHIAKSASADDKALQEAILQSLHESSSMEDCVPYPAPAILNEYEDHTLSTPARAAAEHHPVDSPDSYPAITSNPNSVDRQYPYNLTPEFRKKSSFTLQDGNSNWKPSSFMLPEPPAASAGRIDRWSMEHPREQEQFSSQSPPQMQPPQASHALQDEPPPPRHLRQTSYVSGPTEPNTPLYSEREPTQSSGRTDYEDNEYDHEVHATAADVYAHQHHLHRVEKHPHRRRVRSPPPPYIGDDEEDEVTPLSDYYEENSHPHPHPGPTARVPAHLHDRHDSNTAIALPKDQQYLTYESDYQSHHKEHEHRHHRDEFHHHHRQSYHETSRHSFPPRGYEHVPAQQHTHRTTTMSRRHASASPPRHRHSIDAATAAGHSSVYASSGTDTDHCSWCDEESRRQGHLHHQPVHHGNHHHQPVHHENHHQPVHYENHHQSIRHEQHNYHHTGHARSGQPYLHSAAVPVSYESYPSGSESSAYQSDYRHHLNYGSNHHPSSHNHHRRSYPPHSRTLNLPPPAAFPDEPRGSKHPPPTTHIHAHHRDTPTTTTTTYYHPDTRPRHYI